jgi:uncharacterized repeat protein (TIGR01451 family)
VIASPSSADLSITKDAQPTTVAAGAFVTYTLVAHNAGPADATSATLSDPLPAGTLFQSLSAPAGWSCITPAVGANGTVSCTRPTFAAGETFTFLLAVQVAPGTASGTTLTNTASIGSVTPDPTPVNNSDVEPVVVGAPGDADLGVVKSASPAHALVGGPISYTIVVTNYGPATATGVNLVDTLPAGVTFVSATPQQGSCSGTGPINCSLGRSPSGERHCFGRRQCHDGGDQGQHRRGLGWSARSRPVQQRRRSDGRGAPARGRPDRQDGAAHGSRRGPVGHLHPRGEEQRTRHGSERRRAGSAAGPHLLHLGSPGLHLRGEHRHLRWARWRAAPRGRVQIVVNVTGRGVIANTATVSADDDSNRGTTPRRSSSCRRRDPQTFDLE